VISLFFVILPISIASAESTIRQKGVPSENEWITTGLNGEKIVHVRWPIGSRNNVVTLRVPFAYLPIVGADSKGPAPFMTTKVFDAMLWDMRSLPRHVQLSNEQQKNIVFGLIESIYSGQKERDVAGQLHSRATISLHHVRNNFYQRQYGLKIAEKPDRFGLRRIGPIHNLGQRTPVGLKDFYYTGESPEVAGDFLTCTDEAIPDDPPPGKLANPGCQYWFALPEMSATVKVNFRRRHLSEWREVKRGVVQLLHSWMPNGQRDRL
jgi:hypothetical protein